MAEAIFASSQAGALVGIPGSYFLCVFNAAFLTYIAAAVSVLLTLLYYLNFARSA